MRGGARFLFKSDHVSLSGLHNDIELSEAACLYLEPSSWARPAANPWVKGEGFTPASSGDTTRLRLLVQSHLVRHRVRGPTSWK